MTRSGAAAINALVSPWFVRRRPAGEEARGSATAFTGPSPPRRFLASPRPWRPPWPVTGRASDTGAPSGGLDQVVPQGTPHRIPADATSSALVEKNQMSSSAGKRVGIVVGSRSDINAAQRASAVLIGPGMADEEETRGLVEAHGLQPVLGGLGIAIISTSQGLLTDRQANQKGVGGEVLAYVW